MTVSLMMGSSSSGALTQGGADSVHLSIELWRADLMTSVVELDRTGKVVLTQGDMPRLYPPGK